MSSSAYVSCRLEVQLEADILPQTRSNWEHCDAELDAYDITGLSQIEVVNASEGMSGYGGVAESKITMASGLSLLS